MNSIIATDSIRDKQSRQDLKVEDIAFTKDDGELKALNGKGLSVQNAKAISGRTIEDIEVGYKTFVENSLNDLKDKSLGGNIRLLAKNISSSCGGEYIIAVTYKEEIIAKGYNYHFVSASGFNSSPSYISISNPHKQSKIKEIITARYNIYVLYEDNELYTMGLNRYGSLGIGNTAEQFFLVHSASDVKKVVASNIGYYGDDSFAFILKNDNKLYATGRNVSGNLGTGDNKDKYSWVEVPFLDNIGEIKDIICGGVHNASSYILTQNGEVFSTGYNGNGSLGFNDTTNRNTFTKITALENTKIEKLIVSGGYGTEARNVNWGISVLALSSNNQLFAWGYNSSFCLGTADNSTKLNPVLVLVNLEDDEIIEELYSSSASYDFYFKTNKGNLYGSGNNTYGQLNKSDIPSSNVFIKILENVKDVHITKNVTCGWRVGVYVLSNNDELFVFGYNERGLLGTSSANNIKEALKPPFEHTQYIKQVYSTGTGFSSVYILLEDGRVYGCGNNDYAQIQAPGTNSINRLIRVF